MNLVKNIRLIILLLLLLVTISFLIIPLLNKTPGVTVLSLNKDSKCIFNGGDVISQVGGHTIGNSIDFKNAEKNVKEGEYITVIISNGPSGCIAAGNGYLGVNVADISSKTLSFGIDIQGGVENIFKPDNGLTKDQLNDEVNVLNKRVKILNLPDAQASATDSDISIIALSNDKIGMLIIPGEFEGRISRDVSLTDGSGEIGVGNSTYIIKKLTESSLSVNNYTYEIGQSFYLENINFNLINITNNSAAIEATVFSNDDIKQVLASYSSVKYDTDYKRYDYSVPLQLSSAASNRFAQITKKLPTTYTAGTSVLEGYLVFYLDGTLINKLSIPFNLMGKSLNSVSVIGFKKTVAEASTEMLKVEVATSGKLPAELSVADTKYFAPRLKEKVLLASAVGFSIISLVVLALVYLRYKKIKFGAFVILLAACEIVFVLGAAAMVQTFYGYGWVIDSASVAGLITLFASSSIQMLLLTEKTVRKKDFGFHFKYKKIFDLTTLLNIVIFFLAFFMLFLFKGFGFSLIIGFIFGVLLTKPIYDGLIRKQSSAAIS